MSKSHPDVLVIRRNSAFVVGLAGDGSLGAVIKSGPHHPAGVSGEVMEACMKRTNREIED